MKNYFKIFTSIICVLFVAVILVSCGDGKGKNTEIEKVKVTFDAQGGTTVTSQQFNKGSKASEPSKPEKEGHDFIGWYVSLTETEPFKFTTLIHEHTTLYAKWEKKIVDTASFTVSFDALGGTKVSAQTIKKGEKIVSLEQPTRAGYDFIGWYTSEALDIAFDINTLINEHLTLYAKWEVSGDTITHQMVFDAIKLPETTDKNVTLQETYKNISLEWITTQPKVISNQGVITRMTDDVRVTLILKVTIDGVTNQKDFVIIVLKKVDAPVSEYTPIVEARELPQDSDVTIGGVVTSFMSNGNYSLQDESGAIAVYMNKAGNLKIGYEYVIKGKLSEYQGLIQIGSPTIVEERGQVTLPDIIDLSGYALDFEDFMLYESYLISYQGLEVIAVSSPSNAYEINVKNSQGDTSVIRLDKRVNDSNPLLDIKVGEIINISGLTVGQFKGKSQLMFNSRSTFEVRPADPDRPNMTGIQNITYIIGVSETINYLSGIEVKSASGKDYKENLVVDASGVKLDEPGNYDVTITLNHPTYSMSKTIIVFVRNEAKPGEYEGYYQSLAGLTGEAFNKELQRIIKTTGRATGSTAEVKEADRYNGTYYLIYTGNGSYGNREHVFPAKWFRSYNVGTEDDLHNLRAANVSVNSTRSSFPFGPGTGKDWKLENGKFYPGSDHIGDVARIVLFIATRWGFKITDVGTLDLFLQWHEQDPVDDFEIARNNNIFEIQKNRNPFIDHPELVEIYFGKAPSKKQASFSITTTLRLVDETIKYVDLKEMNKRQIQQSY